MANRSVLPRGLADITNLYLVSYGFAITNLPLVLPTIWFSMVLSTQHTPPGQHAASTIIECNAVRGHQHQGWDDRDMIMLLGLVIHYNSLLAAIMTIFGATDTQINSTGCQVQTITTH